MSLVCALARPRTPNCISVKASTDGATQRRRFFSGLLFSRCVFMSRPLFKRWVRGCVGLHLNAITYLACFKISLGCKRAYRRGLRHTVIHDGFGYPRLCAAYTGAGTCSEKSWKRQEVAYRKPGCVTENRTRYALAARCWGVWKPMITG